MTTQDTISKFEMTMPVGIAEIELPGVPGTGPSAAQVQLPEQLAGTCRGDLMTIDGQPVGLRVNGTTVDAAGRLGLDLRTCGTPVRLGAGDHVLRTADGGQTGIDIDRVVLASDAGGANWWDASATIPALDTTPPTAGSEQAPSRAEREVSQPPTVKPLIAGTTNFVVDVTGAEPGKPFWLILGQSLSAGWQASIDDTSIGGAQLIDGYANGWLITPDKENFQVQLTWVPQRVVLAALAVSGVSVVLCLALLGLGTRQRRSAGARPVPAAASATAGAAGGPSPAGPRPARAPAPPPAGPGAAQPTWDPPFARTPRPGFRSVALLVVGAFAIASFIVSPQAGAITAAVTLVAALVPRGRVLLRVGSVAALAISAAYVLQVQIRYNLPVNGSWVAKFDKVALVSWLAVLFLGADATLALLHGRAARRGAGTAPGPASAAQPAGPGSTAQPAGPGSTAPPAGPGSTAPPAGPGSTAQPGGTDWNGPAAPGAGQS
ncbi:MAG: hypothetical protein IRZ08_05030 [Frankia sp.]|nr:hypothetical protein [Frankia sp.]